MHLDHEHDVHEHEHIHEHSHEHTHADGTVHSHEHTHEHTHSHEHPHTHDHLHETGAEHTHEHTHDHSHGCDPHSCSTCGGCEHTPREELIALMNYMCGHNAAHARELASLAQQLEEAGEHSAYEQVMAAVADFEKGNMRLSVVLNSMKAAE